MIRAQAWHRVRALALLAYGAACVSTDFARILLPDLCLRLERVRSLAAAGQDLAAGRAYQSLLLASQVVRLTLVVWRTAETADTLGQPAAQISAILEVFASQVAPLLEAALTEDPALIARALQDSGPIFGPWVAYLERWSGQLDSSAARVKTTVSDSILVVRP